MDIRKLQRVIVDGLEDVKAQHIVVFNTEALSPLFERVIIASGTSNRQTKALAASVRDAVKALGEPIPRVEGEENGEWIIVDCGAAVAHIMQPAIREYYHLEEIWGMKPVALKAAVKQARTGLPKAEEPAAAPSAKTSGATKKAAATPRGKSPGASSRATPAGKPRAKPTASTSAKTTARTAAKPGLKPAAKRATTARPAAQTAPAKTARKQPSAAGSTAAKTSASPRAQKPVAAARKPAAKPAVKAAAKAAPARKRVS